MWPGWQTLLDYQLHSSVSWFWLEQVLEGSHDPNDRCPVLPHWQGCYRRQRSGGPTLLILSLFSQTGNLYLDVEMQTYIFLFTPRIRLDCTNEIKNWISCEEKKENTVTVCTELGTEIALGPCARRRARAGHRGTQRSAGCNPKHEGKGLG